MPFIHLAKITQILPGIAPFICLAGIVVLQSQEYQKSAQKLNYESYLLQEEQQAQMIEWQQHSPNLGFDNLKANWSYLDFVQYFGDAKARETIGYQLVPEYFTAIAKTDPRFTQAHLRLSIANSMYAGNAEQTVDLMQQVLATVEPNSPESHALWTYKGLDELLFLGDKDAAIDSYQIAARWAELPASDRPDGLTIKDLEAALESTTAIDLKTAQIRAWSSVLVHIKDNQKRREIMTKIDTLNAELAVLEQNQDS